LKHWIVLAFLWTAPLGTLIPVPGTPHSFRFFYLLMAAAIPLLLTGRLSLRLVLFAASQMPFVLYLLWSAVYNYDPSGIEGAEANPLFRALLLAVELIFITLVAIRCQREALPARARLLIVPLLSYLVSMAAGYVFFVGYYAGLLRLETLEPFHVLLQFGYGILRFSPGSYPNEYGNVSSFFASLVLFMLLRWPLVTVALGGPTPGTRWLRRLLLLSFPLMLGALILSTTRAAYLSFIAAVIIIGFGQRTALARIRYFGVAALCTLAALMAIQRHFDILGLIRTAYFAFFEESASAYSRFFEWRRAYEAFQSVPWLGTGYGTAEMIHNIYLQILFSTGLAGALMFGFFFVALQCARQPSPFVPSSGDSERDRAALQLLRVASYLAVGHTLWFGVSNHNLNHFLTWFTVLLVLLVPRRAQPIVVARAPLERGALS